MIFDHNGKPLTENEYLQRLLANTITLVRAAGGTLTVPSALLEDLNGVAWELVQEMEVATGDLKLKAVPKKKSYPHSFPLSTFKTTKTTPDVCPVCDGILNAASHPNSSPSKGDISVCSECASPLVFDAELKLSEMSESYYMDLPDPLKDQLTKIRAAILKHPGNLPKKKG